MARGLGFRLGLIGICVAMLLAVPRSSLAMNRDVTAVATTATYGALGGTALGILAWPFHKQIRGVLVGSSVGLYLGIVVGLYYISNRDNPQNPLAPQGALDLYDPTRERAGDPAFAMRFTREPPPLEMRFRIATFDLN